MKRLILIHYMLTAVAAVIASDFTGRGIFSPMEGFIMLAVLSVILYIDVQCIGEEEKRCKKKKCVKCAEKNISRREMLSVIAEDLSA